jgi:hypothetical protein
MVWMVWWITPWPQWTGCHWTSAATWLLNAQVKGHPFWVVPLSPFASFSLHLLDLAQKESISQHARCWVQIYCQYFSNTRKRSCFPIFIRVAFHLFISTCLSTNQLDRKRAKIKHTDRMCYYTTLYFQMTTKFQSLGGLYKYTRFFHSLN